MGWSKAHRGQVLAEDLGVPTQREEVLPRQGEWQDPGTRAVCTEHIGDVQCPGGDTVRSTGRGDSSQSLGATGQNSLRIEKSRGNQGFPVLAAIESPQKLRRDMREIKKERAEEGEGKGEGGGRRKRRRSPGRTKTRREKRR